MRFRRLSGPPALRLLPLAALAGALIALAPGASASSTSTFTASADTYVDAGTPSTNYGGATSIHADGSPAKWGLVRFKVANLSASVTRATLQVYSMCSSSGYDVHRTSGAWDENTLTWNTAPSIGSVIGSSGSFASGVWTSVDVTRAVSGNGTYAFALTSPSGTNISLSSREGGHAAKLVVVTSTSTTTTGSGGTTSTTSSGPSGQPSFPIRAAFYYPWFPEAWKQSGIYPFTHYTPSAGFYDETQASTIKRQVADMRYAGMDVAIASWWGQGSRTDQRIPLLLSTTRAMGSALKWTIYYEAEGQTNPTVTQIVSDLRYIQSHYASDSAYLKINGKFVVFVYGQPGDAGGMAARWKQASADIGHAAYIVLKAFTGFKNYLSYADSWHQYAPANAVASIDGWSYSISPGFWKATSSTPVLSRSITRFRSDAAAMVASHDPWQLLTTYNEWGEGTAAESATSWASTSGHGLYMDAVHDAVNGTTTTTAASTTTASRTLASTTTAPVVAAAGDIACDPSDSRFNGGTGATLGCREMDTSNLIGGLKSTGSLAGVLTLGDNQYECGRTSAYTTSFGASWGRFKSLIHPVPGNHEYGWLCGVNNANPYFSYFGSAAGPAGKGWYSYNIGSWHLIALNSECNYGTGSAFVGGCQLGSPEETWLRSDLAAHKNFCTLAYWHEPRFSSGEHGDAQQMAVIWNDLVAAHADVVVSGHNHVYERFAPIGATPRGTSAYQSPTLASSGIREFVVGTGGKNHYFYTHAALAGEQIRNDASFGVLKLTLQPTGYAWKFMPVSGSSFTDAGTGACH